MLLELLDMLEPLDILDLWALPDYQDLKVGNLWTAGSYMYILCRKNVVGSPGSKDRTHHVGYPL